jgi:hypothetical protein
MIMVPIDPAMPSLSLRAWGCTSYRVHEKMDPLENNCGKEVIDKVNLMIQNLNASALRPLSIHNSEEGEKKWQRE